MRTWWFLPAFLLATTPVCAAELIRGPTLQRSTEDSIVVTFDLDEATIPAVRLDPGTPDERIIAADEQELRHEILVDGLLPGAVHTYGVYDGELELAGGHQLAPAPGPGAPVTFLIIGDTRSNHDDHAAVIAAMLDEERPDFVLHTGDLVSSGEELEQWDTFFAIEGPLIADSPLVPVVGNHDEFEGDAALYRSLFALPGNELYFSFDMGPLHVVILDSEVHTVLACIQDDQFLDGCLDEEQLAWLANDLATACDRDGTSQILVSIHDGPYSSKESRDGSAQMRALLPLLEEHGVGMIVSGHDHYYERGRTGNDLFYAIVAGGGAGLYDIYEPCDFPHTAEFNASVHHYIRVEIDGQQVHWVAKLTDGSVLDEVTFEVVDACAPTALEPDPGDGDPDGCSCRAAGGGVGTATASLILAAAFALIRRRDVMQRLRPRG